MARAPVVVLVHCPDYEPRHVAEAVRSGLAHFDVPGIAAAARTLPVLLKPNLLHPAPPERGVTTHPAVFSEVARVFLEQGARVAYGDSPNGVFKPLATARTSGILAAAEELGVPMADFDAGRSVAYKNAGRIRQFHVANGALDASAIVNLPRMKTHGLTTMTGALKNLFGVVPGNRKMEFHLTCPDVESFSSMLVDLNLLIRPKLVVMDAIRAMEGNGPGSGSLVDIGLLLFSHDPVAVDAVCCRLMGVDPLSVDHIRMAHERDVGTADISSMDLRGESLERHVRTGFRLPTRSPTKGVPRSFMRVGKNLLVPRPVIDPRLCVKCGECVEACPTTPKALSQEKGAVPRYAYADCIRCFCCQETCRKAAISVKPGPLGRLFTRGA
jgi:uncharacterized protein (DUF362 family)/Pyruvate/2-oxoacid:ferredoxin oxidoreductase delta subunit